MKNILIIGQKSKLAFENLKKTNHKKIIRIHQNISKNQISDFSDSIMDGELISHEYDRNILRSILSSLVPDYEPLKKDEVEPLKIKTSPKAQA